MAQLTNHAWRIEADTLARATGATRVHLMNDLQAQAYALDDLDADSVEPLIPGTPDPTGPRLVLGLGTGCNIAVAHRMGDTLYVPMPNGTIEVEVTGMVFFDEKGERVNG